jgi:AAA domain
MGKNGQHTHPANPGRGLDHDRTHDDHRGSNGRDGLQHDHDWSYELLSPEDKEKRRQEKAKDAFVDDVEKEAYRLQVRAAAQQTIKASDAPEMPKPTTLASLLNEPDEETAWRIAALWPVGGRVVCAAARKTGKSTLTMNVVRSLVDGVSLFNWIPVMKVAGGVAVIDTEMSTGMLRRWYRDLKITKTEKVHLWTLRGKGRAFDILDDRRRGEWAKLLRDSGIDVLILDCLTPTLGALGLTESNDDVNVFLQAFDALLVEATIQDALVMHHMGHLSERSRGASRLRDWPEVEWKLVRERKKAEDGELVEVDNGARFFSAYGRDVELEETRLAYDNATRRLTIAGSYGDDRAALRKMRETELALAIITTQPGIKKTALLAAIRKTRVPQLRWRMVRESWG